MSSYYAPLQVVIKSFEINYTFSSILILVASIYCKKKHARAEKRDCLFGNFLSVSIQNAKSSGANTQTFIKFQNILYLSYLDIIKTL
jgi:hypothetical protein